MSYVRSNSLSLKYQSCTPLGFKDLGKRKFEFVEKTQFLFYISVEKYFWWTVVKKNLISKVMFLIFSLQILPKYSANKTLNIFLRLHENISNLISGGKLYLKGGKIFQERNKVFATNSNFLIFETWWCKPYFSSAFHGSYEFIGWNIKDPPQE